MFNEAEYMDKNSKESYNSESFIEKQSFRCIHTTEECIKVRKCRTSSCHKNCSLPLYLQPHQDLIFHNDQTPLLHLCQIKNDVLSECLRRNHHLPKGFTIPKFWNESHVSNWYVNGCKYEYTGRYTS